MARQRAVIIEGDEDTQTDAQLRAAQERIDFDEADEAEGGELFRVTEEIRSTAGAKLMIVRTYPSTPDMAGYVGEMTPAEFSHDEMARRFGPGRYRVRVMGPKGIFLKGGGPVHIARGTESTTRGTDGGNLSEIAKLIQSMEEQRRAQAAEATARRDKWIELAIPGLLTIIAGIMGKNQGPDLTALVAAMKPAPGPSITDLTTSLASLKSLTESPKDDSKLDLIFKVLELAKEKGGDGGGESNWIDVIRDLLKEGPAMIKPVLESMQQAQQNPAAMPSMSVRPVLSPSVVSAPSPVSDATPSPVANGSTPSPESLGETDMLALFMPMIRGQLAKLFQWASEKRRVELYAEVLLEELPATVHSYVMPQDALKYLQHEHWFEIITAPNMEPRLTNYRDWCDAMRKELIDIIQEQLKKEADDSPPDFNEVEGA